MSKEELGKIVETFAKELSSERREKIGNSGGGSSGRGRGIGGAVRRRDGEPLLDPREARGQVVVARDGGE